jgi:hypothetical protein
MTRIRSQLAVAAALIMLAAAGTVASAARTPSTSWPATVVAYLADHPGGQVINDNQISYQGGALVITLVDPNPLAGPDCPRGWFCFYERLNYGTPRGQLSSCGWQDLGTFNWRYRVESAYYNLDRGSVAFFAGDAYLFQVGVGGRARSDASPFRNDATAVYRYC